MPGRSMRGRMEAARAVVAAGAVRCWGDSSIGQVGDGTTENRLTPTPVMGMTGAVQAVMGYPFACARLADGTVQCWGTNTRGQLGDGSCPTARNVPGPVTGISNAPQIDCAIATCHARLADGTVVGWGGNADGRLGDGTMDNRATPVPVLPVAGVAAVDSGESSVCMRQDAGTVQCLGGNFENQLGDGTTMNRLMPGPVPGVTGVEVLACSGLGYHSCVATASGVSCWGSPFGATPTAVPELGRVTAIGAGGSHVCVIEAGSVRCWGANDDGQLGDGTTTDRAAPAAPVEI